MQPTPDIASKLEAKLASPASSDWLAAATPWHAHLLWLVPAVATVTYLNNRDWGMFEAVPLIIALAVAMTGWYAWSIAWSVLSMGRIGDRLAYLAIGIVGMIGTLMATTGWSNEPDQFVLVVGHLGVGWAVPMIFVRRRGWQLARLPRPEQSGLAATTPFWQFSIGDLFVLTAGLAIYLGLLLANRSHPWQEVLLEVLLLVSGTGILLVGLSWRRFWLAAVVSMLGTATLFLITVAAVNPDALAQPAELLLAVVVFGPAVVLLLAAIAIVRSCGYRLQRGNYTVPSVNVASTNRQPAT